MPYGTEMSVKCPFFVTYNKHGRARAISITCEPLCDNLGFEMTLKSSFSTHQERADYMQLFCCDLYKSCPMYKAIAAKYDAAPEKGRQGAKGVRDGKKQ